MMIDTVFAFNIVYGITFDRLGPRVLGLVGCALSALGLVAWALSVHEPCTFSWATWLVGFTCAPSPLPHRRIVLISTLSPPHPTRLAPRHPRIPPARSHAAGTLAAAACRRSS